MDRKPAFKSFPLSRLISLLAAVLAACGGAEPQPEARTRTCVVNFPAGSGDQEVQSFIEGVRSFRIDACGSLAARAQLSAIDIERVDENDADAHLRLVFLMRFLNRHDNGPVYIP